MEDEISVARALAVGGFIVGAVLVGAGAFILRDSLAEKNWSPVQGRVLASSIEHQLDQETGDGGGSRRHWVLMVRYAYSVGGQEFQSERFASNPPKADTDGRTPPPPELQALSGEYAPGTLVTVFFDPEDPAQATLHPARSADWHVLAAGVVVLVASVLGWMRGR